ncbi:G-type lectin S-receptor-like serine/threonine-protein kinase LECRK1 [Mangifera indica]|uniref:G-type lectin S-receptor-like serine/threonine-protein kinase LECRK1 n=1 Tax=Mangifera indica TaxID=29780 RepID=UPI001CF9FA9F|nr:G-type lectin S-receptor-like serine/threonine-protein kinase LECRK1 [Mangifera indica]
MDLLTNQLISPMAAATYIISFLFLMMMLEVEASPIHIPSKNITLGSSLSPLTEHTSWPSPSGRFAFGFYKQGDGFSVGTWLTTKPDITLVWTAHREDPPVSPNSTLTLTKDGQLILRTSDHQTKDILIANSSEPASFALMFDSGNFVLYNDSFQKIWSSFDFPTDTLLGGQSLYTNNQLVSSVSEANSSTGRFRVILQGDGNLVSYPTSTTMDESEAYWASGIFYGFAVHSLYLNHTGGLVLINNKSKPIQILYPDSSLYNSSIIYRATLGHDGIFRLYSHNGEYNTSLKWKKPEEACLVKTFCGFNSYCSLYDDEARCRCLPGTDFVDPGDMNSGCERYYVEEICAEMNLTTTKLYNLTSMEMITWDDYPYLQEEMDSKEDCGKSCLEDCNCDAALYKEPTCRKQKLPLTTARRDQSGDSSAIAFFKLSKKNITRDARGNSLPEPPVVTSKKAIVLILVMTFSFVTCSCILLGMSGIFVFKYRVAKYKWLLETGNFGLSDELTMRSFSYNELKKATNGFKEEVGRGSFGAVYKGAFYKGEKLVAVKRLEKMINESSEREFHAEMQVIGRIHHKNLVRLLGYCAVDSKRLLVYEYMSNGSLADLLFHSETSPDWNERVRIALDVAKGILYLHDECEAPIIHCDIKPQNILLDDFWTAKISDFGLAKLLMPDQTRTFTLMRGTRGYMAPEWSKNTPISVKADIYSYGVVLLEIIACRRNMDTKASNPDEIILINWVYKCFVNRELNKLVRDEVDKKIFENLVKVGLWCVQDEPALRPSMKSVVMMLEGITDVSIPPCPTSSLG